MNPDQSTQPNPNPNTTQPTPPTPPVPEILPSGVQSTNQPFDQSTPPSPTMHEIPKPKHTFTIILIVLLILLSLTSLGFWAYKSYLAPRSLGEVGLPSPTETPVATPDPTANWKTYTYKDLTFRYPSDWVLNTDTNNAVAVKPPNLKMGEDFPAVTFYAINDPKDLTVKEYEDEVSKEGMSPTLYSSYIGNDKIIAEIRIVGGVTAYYLKDQNCEPLGCDKISFVYNKKIYVITNIFDHQTPPSETTSIEKDSMRRIYDQILSTFKFLGQTDDYQTQIRTVLDKYLTAYEQKNWSLVKQLLSSSVINYFDQKIAEGYDIGRHEIGSITKSDRASNAYTASVKLYDHQGKLLTLNGSGQIDFLIEKDGNDWKIITWYIFP